jgi:hypothetical protein
MVWVSRFPARNYVKGVEIFAKRQPANKNTSHALNAGDNENHKGQISQAGACKEALYDFYDSYDFYGP